MFYKNIFHLRQNFYENTNLPKFKAFSKCLIIFRYITCQKYYEFNNIGHAIRFRGRSFVFKFPSMR